MSLAISRSLCRVLTRQNAAPRPVLTANGQVAPAPWFASVLTLKTSAPLWAEPKKKKKVDPRRDQVLRDRIKRKLKRLEKVPPEMIPIEDFNTPGKYQDEARSRAPTQLSFEDSERRALLLKEWSRYKLEQHRAEMEAVDQALEAQAEALKELRLVSEDLYQAALKPDPLLFPFSRQGPCYTPAKPQYEAPEGKYTDITKVYTQ